MYKKCFLGRAHLNEKKEAKIELTIFRCNIQKPGKATNYMTVVAVLKNVDLFGLCEKQTSLALS